MARWTKPPAGEKGCSILRLLDGLIEVRVLFDENCSLDAMKRLTVAEREAWLRRPSSDRPYVIEVNGRPYSPRSHHHFAGCAQAQEWATDTLLLALSSMKRDLEEAREHAHEILIPRGGDILLST